MTETRPVTAQYFPGIFDTADIEQAKAIILTEEGPDAGTDVRWEQETPYVLDLIRSRVPIQPDTLVLDYGCGVGRMARALIEATGCKVIGVDISPNMRRLAIDYVGSDRFFVASPDQLDMLVAAGLRVNAAIAIWVLQHCFAPQQDITRIGSALEADGQVFVLNMPKRAVPAVIEQGAFMWVHDEIDVAGLLRGRFRAVADGAPDPGATPNMADAGAYWMHMIQRAA